MPSYVSNLEAYAKRRRKPSRIDTYHTVLPSRSYVEFSHPTKFTIKKTGNPQLPWGVP